MFRFAASPTSDMHIGSLRVALFNYIVSKQRDEELIVRIEDADKKKNIEKKDQEILDLLALFNIEHSQVIYQSQNIRFHSAMALQLLHEKKAFSCFCSTEWLEKKRQEADEAKKAYRYDDACRDLPAQLVIDNTNPFTIRINSTQSSNFESDTVDSFIIMNQDKAPTDNFASAVDDMLHNITTVICEEEDIKNSSKQEHVRASLNYDKKIEYIYLPTILDDTLSIKWLLKEGYLPAAISNYLISIGNKLPSEIFTLKEAIEWFDLSMLSKSPTRFDILKLKDINKKHLKGLDDKELSRYVGFADEEIGALAKIYLEEADTTKELKSKIEPIFAKKIIPEAFSKQTTLIKDTIIKAPYFDRYDDFKNFIIKESGVEDENFTKPLRLLLTGAEVGPDIAKIYKYIKNYIGEIVK